MEEAADETKIRTMYLDALEEEEFDKLPPRVYAVGFVRNYAKFLGLDPQVWSEEFQRLAYKNDEEPTIVKASRTPRPRVKLPVKNILVAIIFLAVVIWTGGLLVNYIAQQGTKQPPPDIQNTEMGSNQPGNQNKIDELVLRVDARQNCWLQVIVDGQEQFIGILSAGDYKTFEALQTIDLKAGNAGGIDLNLNGQPLTALGAAGQVAEKKFDINSTIKE